MKTAKMEGKTALKVFQIKGCYCDRLGLQIRQGNAEPRQIRRIREQGEVVAMAELLKRCAGI